MPDNSDVFDYVIVGAGTAGSILTNRLSADGARVCLLEAGPEDYLSEKVRFSDPEAVTYLIDTAAAMTIYQDPVFSKGQT